MITTYPLYITVVSIKRCNHYCQSPFTNTPLASVNLFDFQRVRRGMILYVALFVIKQPFASRKNRIGLRVLASSLKSLKLLKFTVRVLEYSLYRARRCGSLGLSFFHVLGCTMWSYSGTSRKNENLKLRLPLSGEFELPQLIMEMQSQQACETNLQNIQFLTRFPLAGIEIRQCLGRRKKTSKKEKRAEHRLTGKGKYLFEDRKYDVYEVQNK